ncbi:MAG: hypothetical protein HQL53_14840 [Magnetococcales bacterium]|nr:hypothetical protein [Magnetococcales bacterium]
MTTEQVRAHPRLKFPFLSLFFALVLIISIYFVITASVWQALNSSVTRATQAGNAAITRIFINEVYPALREDLNLTADSRAVKSALTEQELGRVDARVRAFMFGTDILKAKIFTIDGNTIYSSDLSQVGDDKKSYPGFEAAMRGKPTSKVTHRDSFSGLAGEVYGRDLVASYIPIRDRSDEIIGVAELYTDRSTTLEDTQRLMIAVKAELIPMLTGILLAIALIIWRFSNHIAQIRIQQLDDAS